MHKRLTIFKTTEWARNVSHIACVTITRNTANRSNWSHIYDQQDPVIFDDYMAANFWKRYFASLKDPDLIMAVLNLDICLPVMLEEASRVAATVWLFPWIADGLHNWVVLIRAVRDL
jgi:hypothetical protein